MGFTIRRYVKFARPSALSLILGIIATVMPIVLYYTVDDQVNSEIRNVVSQIVFWVAMVTANKPRKDSFAEGTNVMFMDGGGTGDEPPAADFGPMTDLAQLKKEIGADEAKDAAEVVDDATKDDNKTTTIVKDDSADTKPAAAIVKDNSADTEPADNKPVDVVVEVK